MIKSTRLMAMALTASLLASGAVYAAVTRYYKAPTVKANTEGTPTQTPGKITDITATNENGSLEVTFNFTMPTGLYSASAPAVGWLKYSIREANKFPAVVYAEGDADFGEQKSVKVTFEEAGYHTFALYAVNEKGQSSPAPNYPYLQMWVGPGKPSNVTGINLSTQGTTATLTWNAVTTPTNTQAFFAPEEVTYTVVRTPGDVTVAENISATTFSETLTDSGSAVGYRYSVTASFRGQSSDPAFSNGAPIGTSAAPWTADLTSVNDFLTFTPDPSDNNYIWQWDAIGNRAKLSYNSFGSTPGNDDWLITPGLRLEKGKLYPVSFFVTSYSRSYTHTLEVKAGTSPAADAMTIDVVADTEMCTESSGQASAREIKGFFLAPETGVYYIGLHDKSTVKVADMYAYSFTIGEGMAGTAPEAVTDISITSDVDVAPPTAEISFKAPAVDIAGNALGSVTSVVVSRDGTPIHTFENPAPGAELTWTDVLEPDQKGEHLYSFLPANASGNGRPAEYKVFVGDYRIHPPYTALFDNEEITRDFTIIDVDNAGASYNWTFERSYKYMSCNSSYSKDCDDWLITPAIWLKGGFRYTFTIEVMSYYNDDKVPFEIYMGNGNTVEAMTLKLGELKGDASNIGKTWQTFSYTADPAADGSFCFAVRYLGSGNSCKLCLRKLEVSDGLNVGEPKAIDDFTATPDFGGEAKVSVAFTAPSESMSGTALASLSRIELFRDDVKVNTFENPAPGAALSFEDTGMEPGYHTYRVTPWGVTEGESSEVRVFVGANVPAAPENAVVKEDASATGNVTLSWEAPALDVDGAPINPALVKYNIYALSIFGDEPELLFEGVEGTSHTFMAVPEDEQHFVWYRVKAVTAAGESEKGAETEVLAAGVPYTMPFVDSFADGYLTYEFNSERLDEYPAEWILYSDRDFSNLVPQDDDNGIIGMYAPYTMGTSRLMTGKIAVTDAENPMVSVWFRAVRDSQSKIALEVLDCGAETPQFVQLVEKPLWASDYPEDWVKLEASLADYKGKTVQIGVTGTAQSQNYIFLDNLRVSQQYDHNLVATAIAAPARMYPGEEAAVAVRFQNFGAMAAEGFTVDLYRNDLLVQSRDGLTLAPDASAEVRFTEVPDVTMPGQLVYHAVVNYAPDQVAADNTTPSAEVALRLPDYPVVDDLAGTTERGVNSLAWSQPEIPAAGTPQAVTEDFESFPSFAKADLDDWKLVDADGEEFGGFGELTLPGIKGGISYFVMDAASEILPYDPQGLLAAHSGSRYLVSGWVEGETGINDDWIISPMVSATSDQLSFWAKSYDASLLETFEVLYSTTDRSLESFKRVRLCANVPAEWTEYEFTLPEGTRYFAIRCISNDRFMLFIDDITYTPADESEPMTILGYNVYRDNVKINDAVIPATAFDDALTQSGQSHSYAVSTVLNLGESRLSNSVTIVTSSIDAVTGAGISITVEGNTVIVTGAEGLNAALYDTVGRLVATTLCSDPQRIPVPAGVALLTVGSNTYKLLVK